jgi:hypothetical protein
MKSVRKSCTFASACDGLCDNVPESSRKFNRSDLASRLSSKARSKRLASLDSDCDDEGRLVIPWSSRVGSLSSS